MPLLGRTPFAPLLALALQLLHPAAGAAQAGAPRPAAAAPAAPAAPASAGSVRLSLEQVIAQGLPASLQLQRADRAIERDAAASAVQRALLLPQLQLVGLGSYTQVGTSVGVLTNLPTLGDISLSLEQNGYAVLRNSFGNAGVVFDLNLLPLRQLAELSASRSREQASLASRRESERQSRFELVRAYRDLQLRQALVPVWRDALAASRSLEADVVAIERRGLAARIDVLRARALRAGDEQGLAQMLAQLAAAQNALAILLGMPAGPLPEAADPIAAVPPWPLDLATTLERAERRRPLLEALQEQQRALSAQARAARAALYPSVSLLAGAGYSGDQLSVPVLNQGGSLDGPVPVALPNLSQSGGASGSFYNWGVALLLRQPLYDGGRAGSAARLAEREGRLLQADEQLARQQIRLDVSRAWSALQAAPGAVAASRQAVAAGERALRDARLRYRAQVDPLTEVLLVQRDLQAARASLYGTLTGLALERALLERETGELGEPAEPAAPGKRGILPPGGS